jgi:glyoxylase-like metal-dependent hydrolase (beta-lactamase superfamily II)
MSMTAIQRMETLPFEPEVFLHEGLTLESYGVGAKVIELPGHTKGSVGIVVGKTDIIVGDALMNIFYPCKSMLYEDREVMERSAQRISSFTNSTIYFGHGKPSQNKVW